MFDINTAQVTDQVLLEVQGQKVTGIITKIRPHTINWNAFEVYVTLDQPVTIWDMTDIRTSFCITHDITGIWDTVKRIIA